MRRDFAIFWATQALSVAGDMFSFVALPLLVLRATGSVAQMGLLTAVGGIGRIAAGFVAGSIVDRFNRRTVLIVCDAGRAVLFGAVPLGWLFAPQLWLLYAAVLLGTAAGTVFQVGYVAAVPNLVEPGRMTEANGRLNASFAAASIVGPSLAGIVSHAFGPSVAVGIDAATFALSALGLGLVRLARHEPVVAHPRRDFLDGLRFLWRQPTLRALTILLTVQLFLTTGLEDIFIYYLKTGLHQSDSTVGYVLALAGVGSIIAALAVAPVRRRLGYGATWIGSQTLLGLALAAVGSVAAVPYVAAMVVAFMFALGTGGTLSMSLRQEVTPNALLGRVTAAFWTVHYALAPLGAAVLTALAGRVGVAAVCLTAGAGCLAIALAALLTPIRLAHPEAARTA
jgi:predicted MFS family arabinose efflux permease